MNDPRSRSYAGTNVLTFERSTVWNRPFPLIISRLARQRTSGCCKKSGPVIVELTHHGVGVELPDQLRGVGLRTARGQFHLKLEVECQLERRARRGVIQGRPAGRLPALDQVRKREELPYVPRNPAAKQTLEPDIPTGEVEAGIDVEVSQLFLCRAVTPDP